VFSPTRKPYVEFESSEEINNYLLRDPEVQAFIASRGGRPKVAMLFFNEETERICAELGYEITLPPHALRRRLDSKIVTTELGNEAGALSVPNVLVEVGSWLVRQRPVSRGAVGRAQGQGDRTRQAARRPARAGGLPGLLRDRRPHRPRRRRGLPR